MIEVTIPIHDAEELVMCQMFVAQIEHHRKQAHTDRIHTAEATQDLDAIRAAIDAANAAEDAQDKRLVPTPADLQAAVTASLNTRGLPATKALLQKYGNGKRITELGDEQVAALYGELVG
jgi:hypothetical protein